MSKLWNILFILLLLLCFPLSAVVVSAQSFNDFIVNANKDQDDPVLQWCQAPTNWQRPYMVALLADPQVGWNLDQYNSEALFREAATHLQRLHPDLILIAGDMIQTPMSKELEELSTAKSILEGLNIPYFLTSGNHDVFQRPTVQVLQGFRNYWQTPNYWYAVEYSNTLFVFLETNILLKYKDKNAPKVLQQLAEEQLEWLETTLQNDQKYDHIVPIAHHPMAIQRINEDDTLLNTPRQVRSILQTLYQNQPAITHVFGGHIHRRATIQNEQGINYIAYPSTGVVLDTQPSGFALLTVRGSQPLQEQYYGYNDMPRNRPDLSNANLEVTFPAGNVDLTVHSAICITWTSSTSMTNRVQLLYSTDLGASWTLIGEGPNVGVYPWRVPATLSDKVLVAVASVYDPNIIGASPQANRIVLPEEAKDTTVFHDVAVEEEEEATTNPPQENLVWVRGGSSSSSQRIQSQQAMKWEEETISSASSSMCACTAIGWIVTTALVLALL